MDRELFERLVVQLGGEPAIVPRTAVVNAPQPPPRGYASGSQVTSAATAAIPRSGLATALTTYAQRTSIQTVGAKVITGELRNPPVPELTTEQFDSFLLPPHVARGERPCLLGPRCTAYDIPGWNGLRGAGPLREFKFDGWPAEDSARHLSVGGGDVMPCMSCIMQSQTTHVYEHMRTRTEPAEILQVFQVRIAPGEFRLEDCHPAEAWGRFTGTPYPVQKWDLTKFAWVAREPDDENDNRRARVRSFFQTGPPASRAPSGGLPQEEEEEGEARC